MAQQYFAHASWILDYQFDEKEWECKNILGNVVLL